MKLFNTLSKTGIRNQIYASIVLMAGIGFTTAITFYTKNLVLASEKSDFQSICSDIQTKIYERINAQAQLLRCGAAFFAASDSVTRNDWKNFFRESNVDRNLPGIQGLGFALIIPKSKLKQHISRIRNEGFPDYMVKPESARDIYTPIIYIEPFKDRNLRAFGFDMFSEPIRRRAMEISRDSNLAVLSGKVTLIQETDVDVQPGMLMYVPVYKKNMPLTTVAQRRFAVNGWIYSPLRMNDLMGKVLGRWGQVLQGRIRLRIYDGEIISNETLLFDSQSGSDINNSYVHSLSLNLNYHGNNWSLIFHQSDTDISLLENRVFIVFAGGIIITVLLFSLFLAFINTRQRAQIIAEKLTSELKEGRERFQALLNSAAEAIYGIDNIGCCTFSNSACLALLGYPSRDQIIGSNMHWLTHHSYPDGGTFMEDKCQLYTALKQESRFHSDDYFLYRADGSCFPAEIWSHPLIINGRVEGAVVTFLDISKRREAEREVRESATRLSLATRGSGVGIWDLDLIKNVLVWDDQMYRLYGITKEKFGGAYESWIKGLHPDDVAGENKKVEEAINGTKDFDTEFRVVWPDESVHNIRGLAIVISNDSGKPIRMIGTNWDITGQKKIEEDLMKAMAEADLANKAKSEFLLNISHEFRTPLNAVLGFADMLESAEGKNRKEYADSVRSGGRRLLTMVDDILDFIRLEKTGLEPELDFIDTYGFFHEFEKSFADSISEKGLKFKTIISEDLPASILIDERRLRQIITKLIDNAIKYTLQGDVGLNVYQKRSDCSEAEGKTDLIIEVSDTGKGIPEEFRKKIFEAFSQSENKTILDGIGMGLSLTQRIVSCLKGTIKVISQEGMGSKFIVTIPGIGFRNGIKAPVQSDGEKPEKLQRQNKELENITDLQGFISALEGSLFYKYKALEIRQPIGDVKEFGQSLIDLGKQHNYNLISDYGQKLVDAANNFDIDRMLKLIRRYSEYIGALKV